MLDILITLTVVTILPCICTSIHHVVPLKYMHFYLKSKIADSWRGVGIVKNVMILNRIKNHAIGKQARYCV